MSRNRIGTALTTILGITASCAAGSDPDLEARYAFLDSLEIRYLHPERLESYRDTLPFKNIRLERGGCLGFDGFDRSYVAPMTDQATVTVTVRAEDGRTIDVSDYGNHGPSSLWTIQQAIDGVAEQVWWQKR